MFNFLLEKERWKMAIVKIVKRDCPYVTIDKQGIDDSTLSWEATGLLTYLIGRPSNWKINITHLSSVKTNGERSTRRALLELREHNYCHYFEIRKKGRVTETIYLVFEVPTDYEEVMKSHVDLQEDEQLYYKEVKIDNSPKVRNEVSVESNEKATFSPKVRNAKPENAKGENEALINIDSNNNRENKKRNHDHEKHDFEKIFHKFEVNYTLKHKTVIEKLLKTMTEMQIIKYLQEQWDYVEHNENIKNKQAYFSSLILREKAVLKDYVSQNKQEELSSEEDRKQTAEFIEKVPQFRQTDIEEVTRNIEEIKKEKEEIKIIEVTEEEYEKFYQKYLKENEIVKDTEIQRRIFKNIVGKQYKVR